MKKVNTALVIDEKFNEILFNFSLQPLNHFYLSGHLKLIRNNLVILQGLNGIGKTSLMKFLFELREGHLLREGSAFCSSDLFRPTMSVDVESLIDHFLRFNYAKHLKKTHSDYKQKIKAILTDFGFREFQFHQGINFLSSGQNKILKNILYSFSPQQIFFWDEPFEFLDLEKRNKLGQYFSNLIRNSQAFHLMVSHSLELSFISHFNNHLSYYELFKVEKAGHDQHDHVIEIREVFKRANDDRGN